MAKGFYGRYTHTVDAKGRMIVPAKFREKLGSGFMAAAVLDHCVSLYSGEEWDRLMEGLNQQPLSKARELQRYLSSNAQDVDMDAQGRILLPESLIRYAFLEREVVVLGAGNHAEIWDPSRLAEYDARMTDDRLEEQFIELGF